MGRKPPPVLDDYAHPEDSAVEPHTGAQSEVPEDERALGRSLVERFQSFVNLLRRPYLSAAQKRLFDRPLDELVADARCEVETWRECGRVGQYGPPVTTANTLLDDGQPWRPRLLATVQAIQQPLWLCGAGVAAILACVTLVLPHDPGRASAPEPTEIRPAPLEVRSYPIEQTARVNDLAVVFDDVVERPRRQELNIYTINYAEKS